MGHYRVFVITYNCMCHLKILFPYLLNYLAFNSIWHFFVETTNIINILFFNSHTRIFFFIDFGEWGEKHDVKKEH